MGLNTRSMGTLTSERLSRSVLEGLETGYHRLNSPENDYYCMISPLVFSRVLFVICPTGSYCREDRCQSYFNFELVPSMRAPLEECEGAAGITAAGGKALIIDAPAEKITAEELLNRTKEWNPDLIVIAVTFGSLEEDLRWAERFKTMSPGVAIALRGAPCYVWGRELLGRCAAVDFCIRGDYEVACQSLACEGTEASGLIYRDSQSQVQENAIVLEDNLDALPFQERGSLQQNRYTVRGTTHTQATIHVQRGCPFPCTFCLVHTVTGKQARHRSPESIVQEVQQLQQQGINYFYLRAETFTLDKRWAIAVSEALQRSCPRARWVTATRVECVDDAVIRAMKAGGCYGISFGVDVASKEIGRRVKKIPQLAAAQQAMRLCDAHTIMSLAYIMIGFIWDTPETIQEASHFIRAIRPDLVTVHFAHPYPGTPYYQAVKDAGIPISSLLAQATPAVALPGITPDRLHRLARVLLIKHYVRPTVIFSVIRKLLATYRMG